MKKDVRKLTLVSLFTAIIFIVTRFVQIPIPLGYATISNAIIVFCCIFIEGKHAVFAASIGSALADLISFPIYTIPTIILKGLMPIIFGMIIKLPIKKIYLKYLIAGSVVMLVPVAGYTIVGCILYGTKAGVLQIPGLSIEYVINVFISVFLINTGLRMKKSIYRN